MKFYTKDRLFGLIIFLISIVFVFDFFIHKGRPATFDAPFHITNIAQYSTALKEGEFPVYWLNNFANFGLPIGIISHQLPSYIGAVFNIILNDPTLSYNILVFLGVFLSSLFFYLFLRIYFLPIPSFIAVFIFTFAPYRILNAYIRGAEPEIFSNIFLPLILIAIYRFVFMKAYFWLFAFTILIFLLAITHPMNLLIYSFIIAPYILFSIWQKKKERIKNFVLLLISGLWGIAMAAYYLLPLNLELKYFYVGLTKNQLAPNHFLGPINFFKERWEYQTAVDVFTRGHIVQTGIIETVIFIIGLALLVAAVLKKRKFGVVELFAGIGLIIIFFTTSLSSVIYDTFLFLGNIQFPWRMLNGFIFIPPVIAAYIFSKNKNLILVILFLILVSLIRVPQLYGKNFIVYPDSIYYFTQLNVHSDLMNTIWADKPRNYPVKTKQFEIIGGEGNVVKHDTSNSRREYQVIAETDVRMIDYTFFFPGWRVFIDGKEVPVEFQDQNHRGLITYMVPQGDHNVVVGFFNTKIRLIGELISLFAAIALLIALIFRKKLFLLMDRI